MGLATTEECLLSRDFRGLPGLPLTTQCSESKEWDERYENGLYDGRSGEDL
jgi:hypothetical protein